MILSLVTLAACGIILRIRTRINASGEVNLVVERRHEYVNEKRSPVETFRWAICVGGVGHDSAFDDVRWSQGGAVLQSDRCLWYVLRQFDSVQLLG